jgi:NAD-dependent dihydropyrimidine dehydrogenase PreA subunit
MTTLAEQIASLVEKEVERKISEALTEFANRIALSHRIPLSLLLRDMPSQPTTLVSNVTINTCRGVTAKGSRCTRNGICEGYCKMHLHQKQKVQPVKISSTHNHGIPPLFRADCPACAAGAISAPKKPLIDCSVFLRNNE